MESNPNQNNSKSRGLHLSRQTTMTVLSNGRQHGVINGIAMSVLGFWASAGRKRVDCEAPQRFGTKSLLRANQRRVPRYSGTVLWHVRMRCIIDFHSHRYPGETNITQHAEGQLRKGDLPFPIRNVLVRGVGVPFARNL